MKENEIEKRIQKDYSEFYSQKYEGKLPSNIISFFVRALFVLAPNVHQIRASKIKELSEKKPDGLTNLEVGVVVNTILSAPLDKIYKDFDEALSVHSELEKVKDEYNAVVDKLNDTLARKKKTLYNLSGTNDGPVRKIIAEA